jgi:hypothetical protein
MPDEATTARPARRVTLVQTGYLTARTGGWYDFHARADGGETWSVPEFAVDEASVCDAPPETLTADDWSEICGTLAACLGKERMRALVARFETAVEEEQRPVATEATATAPPDRERDNVFAHLLGELENAKARLSIARDVLVKDGYFTADEVGDDIAPRLGEWLSHHRARTESAEALVARVREVAGSWDAYRYVAMERGLDADPAHAVRKAAFREARDALTVVLGGATTGGTAVER